MRWLTIVLLIIVNASAYAQLDVMIDPRDGKEYKITGIGAQVWMAENLRYADTIDRLFSPDMYNTKYSMISSGKYQTIPEYNSAHVYCYDDANTSCQELGMLYTWQAAMNACPAGWHLPSTEEFNQLLLTLERGDKKETVQRLIPGGSSGFDALLVGYLAYGAGSKGSTIYLLRNKMTGFWTSAASSKHSAKYLRIQKKAFISEDANRNAFSVRCLKDVVP